MGNKLLSFIGPPHHIQLIRPLERELQSKGWQCERFTADTEACFQVGLQEYYPGEPFYWLPDYLREEKASRLYREHEEWFRSLWKEPNPFSLVLPQTIDRIIDACCREWVSLSRLLDKVKPSACLALHEINRWGRMLGFHCHTRKIPYFTLQEGLYYGDPWLYTNHTQYSHSFVWGESTKKVLLAAGASPERLHLTGHPDLGRRKALAARSPLQVGQGSRKVVLLFLTALPCHLHPDMLAGWEEQEEYHLVVRQHQMTSLPFKEEVQGFFKGKGNVTLSEGEGEEPGDLWRLLEQAAVCIVVGCSSLILEWLTTPRPLVVVPPPLVMARDYTRDPPVALNGEGKSFYQMVAAAEQEWTTACGPVAARWVREELAGMVGAPLMASLIQEAVGGAPWFAGKGPPPTPAPCVS